MRKRVYWCKFDKWLTEKSMEDSWGSVVMGVLSAKIIGVSVELSG